MCDQWCRWIISIPKIKSPTIYDIGTLAAQTASVENTIFLCQNFDFQYLSTGLERRVTIPAGWSVFMPVINWISVLEKEERGKEDDIKKLAGEKMDEAANLEIKVNGTLVPLCFDKFRIQSFSEKIEIPKDNIFDMEPGTTSYVTDGFWIFFKPLSLDLTLETYGSCQSGIIQIASKYHLIIRNK